MSLNGEGRTLKAMVRLGKTPDDCWQWLGAVDDAGYGKKEFHGKTIVAGRWMWEQLFGPIPPEVVISYACGNRACVNPNHLRATDQAGACRQGIGSVLTPPDVAAIKAVRAEDRTPAMARTLAQQCGCSKPLVYDVWGKRAWARRERRHHNQIEAAA
jgi:hypothetical protein